MKKIFLLIASGYFLAGQLQAQEFNRQIAEAKAAYSSGKLDDSRFAMQQLLQELDLVAGKEILKLLPAKMIDQAVNTASDNVTSAAGYLGTVVHRDYGAAGKQVTLEIVTNSPLLSGINALLAIPLIANNGDYKMVKISGYKALVTKVLGSGGTPDYELQLPINSSLITLKAPGYSQEQLLQMANTIPVGQVMKLIQ